MKNREFTELMKGCRPIKDRDGNIIVQSILNMQLVCLTTDKEYSLDQRFGNPMTALVASNESYGNIDIINKENKEVIIPTQIAVITKQRAQNHAMIKGGYIAPKRKSKYRDAGCVQGSQGGYFRNTQEFRFVPITMREMLFESVGDGVDNYSRTYPATIKLGEETQSNTGEYLDIYFNKYDKKLEQFIAHFERPKNLIGVIVLIDGEIVAIDKFPSFTYAEQIWDALIRDCYGSLAIISELKKKSANNIFTDVYNDIKKDHKGNVVTMIENALKKTKEKISNSIYNRIEEILDMTFNSELDKEGHTPGVNKPKSYILKNEGYIGQVITESEYNHMVSIIKKESFNPDSLRFINGLRKKARSQDRFSL